MYSKGEARISLIYTCRRNVHIYLALKQNCYFCFNPIVKMYDTIQEDDDEIY